MQYSSIGDVKHALDILYNSKEQDERRSAENWLQDFQKQTVAWEVGSSLLKEENVTYAFFGAHTLCNKIRYDLNELPNESIQQLSMILFEAANSYKNVQSSVRNELCLVLATLLIRWTGISDIVNVVVHNIGTNGNEFMLLNILSLLPLEVNSSRIPIFKKQREDKIHDMQSSARSVLQYIDGLLRTSQNDESIVEQIFKCFEAWVSLNSFSAEELGETILLPSLFQAIHIPSLFGVCSDALNEVLNVYSVFSRDDAVINVIIPQIAQMKPLAVEAVTNNDYDMCRRITLIYTQLGNDYLTLLIDDNNTYKDELLDTMFILYSFPSIAIASLCARFWEELLIVLHNPEPNSPVYHLIYKLMTASLPHLMFPEDVDRMTDDDIYDFKQDRRELSDIVLNCCSMLGDNVGLNYLQQSLDAAIQEFMQLSDSDKVHNWQRVESLLFIIRLFGVPYSLSSQSVVQFVDILYSLPSITPLEHASIRLLCGYCRLIRDDYPALEKLLNFFFKKIEKPELHSDCVELFFSICKDCATSIIRNADFTKQLLQLYQSIPQQMKGSDKCTMMQGLCSIIRILPPDLSSSYIVLYLNSIVAYIRQICQMNTVNGAASEMVTAVHLLTVVIRYVAQPNSPATKAMVGYFQENWNLFITIMSVFGQNEDVVEAVCRFFKYFMRQDRTNFICLLQQTCDLILEGYKQTHISSFIYCGSVIVGEYGCNENCQSIILQILTVFCDSTLALLASGVNAYTDNPFIVEDLYDLCGRTLQTIPNVMFNVNGLVLRITQAAIIGIQLQHREANRSILRYLDCLLSYGYGHELEEGEVEVGQKNFRPQVEQILMVCGEELMNQLIGALIGGLPESRIKESGVTVIGVLSNYFDAFRDTFIPTFSITIDKIPEKLFSREEKQQFIQDLFQSGNYSMGRFESLMITLSSITRSRLQHE